MQLRTLKIIFLVIFGGLAVFTAYLLSNGQVEKISTQAVVAECQEIPGSFIEKGRTEIKLQGISDIFIDSTLEDACSSLLANSVIEIDYVRTSKIRYAPVDGDDRIARINRVIDINLVE